MILDSFVKQTAGGQLLTVVKEHYLRDDIASGCALDPACTNPENHVLSNDADHILIVDTNVVLHQTDFLEHKSITDVVILNTVYREVQHKNSSIFLRLKNLLKNTEKRFYYFSNEFHKETYVTADEGESPNDRNDRAIRVASQWYQNRVKGKQIILLTGDVANRDKALQMGLEAMSMQQYSDSKVKESGVRDLIVTWDASDHQDNERGGKRRKLYKEHLQTAEMAALHPKVQAGIKAGRYIRATLEMNRYNPTEGWITRPEDNEKILIKGFTNLNRAFDGDTVIVEVLDKSKWETPSSKLPAQDESQGAASIAPEVEAEVDVKSDRQPCGEVVGIVKRSWRPRGYTGKLKEDTQATPGHTTNALFVPSERSIPFISIKTRQAAQLMDKVLTVVVDEWPVYSRHPLGHYVRTLGKIGELGPESEALLLEHDVNTAPFTSAVHACVPVLPAKGYWQPSAEDVEAPWRRDLRNLCVCSVDPPGCKDIDDALHARPLPNGNIEVGVHIADVTHFCQAGSAMDEEACKRSTTVYLVDRRIDMFPKPLTEDICSLRAGVDRLAFSVLWEMTPDVEVVDVSFTKSVIHSRAAMTYQDAQELIDGTAGSEVDKKIEGATRSDITLALKELMRISKILRQRRFDAGALSLASPEVKFKLDNETNKALEVGMYQLRDTNSMVEEMMLMANITVATHIHKSFPSCAVLRRHETPTPEMFKPLLQALQVWGISLATDTSKQFAESLDRAVMEDDEYFNQIVRIMATRCMTQAKYFSSGNVSQPKFLHYGLAAPIYTHFTSPIRRYADVLVHRCLAASLGLMKLPEVLRDRDEMEGVVENMNDRHTNAARAGRSSAQLHTLTFFKGKELVAAARVIKVRANGVIVLVPEFGIEGPIYFNEGADAEEHTQGGTTPASGQQEISLPNGRVFKMFSKCMVKIFVRTGANHRTKLCMELVDDSEMPDQ